jgi:hypothetical protein
MADGKECKCAAYSESECGCDADWTPQEVYDLRAENERLRITLTERRAVGRAIDWLLLLAQTRNDIHTAGYLCDDAAVLRGLLERTK